MQVAALLETAWREPAPVLSALAERPWALGFLSGGDGGRWSYVAAEPAQTLLMGPQDAGDPFVRLAEFAPLGGVVEGGPPFQGGVAGLLSYDLADRIEPLDLGRLDGWPDLACGRYDAVLAFDHRERRLFAVGRGRDRDAAEARRAAALAWLTLPVPERTTPAAVLEAETPEVYEAAVADVVERICAGEIFQANIARRWRGPLGPGVRPVDLLLHLADASPAPFAAYLRLPDRALVSNSPERFLRVAPTGQGLVAETLPIKGTAPRDLAPAEDARLAAGLLASEKDRAENLMIVDLMRNDLSRVCTPGSVRTPALFELASFANVHHLVSTVTGRLQPDRTAIDLLRAAFPPGSITGAPKVQAIKVIRRHEAPRGPFFGSMFHLGVDGALDSNVLIRTVGFVRTPQGWTVECRAGAGVVADSDPQRERLETESKIAAIAAALLTS